MLPPRWPVLAALVACLSAPLTPSPATATPRLAAQLDDAPEAAGEVPSIDLRSARLSQSGNRIRIEMIVHPHPSALLIGGAVCARFDKAPPPASLCARRQLGGWRLTAGEVDLGAATVERDGALTGAARLTDVGLTPGQNSWFATADAGQCQSADGGCVDRVPAAPARATFSLWRPVATGCTAVAPATFTSGSTAMPARVALTFDDGPGAFTPQVLDILRRERVPATFFVLGRHVDARAATLRVAVNDGHELGNHTWNHLNLANADSALATDELQRTNAAVRAAAGVRPCVFRPPHGASSARLEAVAGALGLATVIWSLNSIDTTNPGAEAITKRVVDAAKSGSIVLLHDGGADRSQTAAALPGIIAGLRRRGFLFGTASQVLGFSTSYVLVPVA